MNDPNIQLLHPGTSIRPILDVEKVEQLVTEHYALTVVKIVELNGYDDKNYHVQVEKNNEDHCEEGYVFKVINIIDSAKIEIFDAQTSLLIYLGKKSYLEVMLDQYLSEGERVNNLLF